MGRLNPEADRWVRYEIKRTGSRAIAEVLAVLAEETAYLAHLASEAKSFRTAVRFRELSLDLEAVSERVSHY